MIPVVAAIGNGIANAVGIRIRETPLLLKNKKGVNSPLMS